MVLRADRNLFSQMILVAESGSVNMKDVLAHPLDPLRYRDMQQGKALYDTYEETYFKMTTYEWVKVAELQSTQEEADTGLLLHALHAARTGSKAVKVTTEDTDVMLICFAFQKDIPCPIYQMCV